MQWRSQASRWWDDSLFQNARARSFPFQVSEKSERRGSTEPRRVTIELGNYERRSCYFFFLAAFFLAAGFLAAFFLAIILYLLRLVIRTRGSMVWRAGFPRVTSWTISSARTSYATQRVSPRSLFDEVSETLAVMRNGPLTRVGSVASVVATTSSIAIQVVLIHRLHPSRQEITKIFFHAMPGEVLRMRDLHDGPRPLEGPSTHRMRTM